MTGAYGGHMTSQRIAVVGGHGQISRLLHPLLVERGHTPIALVRAESQRPELEAMGAEVRLLDIENAGVEEFQRAFDGADAIVFAAGGGPDGNVERKRTVDLEGSLKSVEAAQASGIRRFVQVSAIDVDNPVDPGTPEVWAAYVDAKRRADEGVRATDLDWTIVRPGRLTDDEATGQVAVGPDVPRGDVTRADVAAVLAELLDRGAGSRCQFNLVGGSTPIAEAVTSLSAQSGTDE